MSWRSYSWSLFFCRPPCTHHYYQWMGWVVNVRMHRWMQGLGQPFLAGDQHISSQTIHPDPLWRLSQRKLPGVQQQRLRGPRVWGYGKSTHSSNASSTLKARMRQTWRIRQEKTHFHVNACESVLWNLHNDSVLSCRMNNIDPLLWMFVPSF